jgi:hypothetical protein
MNGVFTANYSGLSSIDEEWFGSRIKGLQCMAVNSTGVCIIHNPGMAHHLLEGQSL